LKNCELRPRALARGKLQRIDVMAYNDDAFLILRAIVRQGTIEALSSICILYIIRNQIRIRYINKQSGENKMKTMLKYF